MNYMIKILLIKEFRILNNALFINMRETFDYLPQKLLSYLTAALTLIRSITIYVSFAGLTVLSLKDKSVTPLLTMYFSFYFCLISVSYSDIHERSNLQVPSPFLFSKNKVIYDYFIRGRLFIVYYFLLLALAEITRLILFGNLLLSISLILSTCLIAYHLLRRNTSFFSFNNNFLAVLFVILIKDFLPEIINTLISGNVDELFNIFNSRIQLLFLQESSVVLIVTSVAEFVLHRVFIKPGRASGDGLKKDFVNKLNVYTRGFLNYIHSQSLSRKLSLFFPMEFLTLTFAISYLNYPYKEGIQFFLEQLLFFVYLQHKVTELTYFFIFSVTPRERIQILSSWRRLLVRFINKLSILLILTLPLLLFIMFFIESKLAFIGIAFIGMGITISQDNLVVKDYHSLTVKKISAVKVLYSQYFYLFILLYMTALEITFDEKNRSFLPDGQISYIFMTFGLILYLIVKFKYNSKKG